MKVKLEGPDDDLDGFEKYDDSAWFAAIRAADTWRDASVKGPKKTGNMNQLVHQLCCRLSDAGGDEVTITREECELLIDLLSRHGLKQKPGGRKVPAYKRSSWAELKLEIASESVRYYQSRGLSLDDAVERVVAYHYVQANSLQLFMKGRLHRERRRIKPSPKVRS